MFHTCRQWFYWKWQQKLLFFGFSLDRTIYQDVVCFTYALISVFKFFENIRLGLQILFVTRQIINAGKEHIILNKSMFALWLLWLTNSCLACSMFADCSCWFGVYIDITSRNKWCCGGWVCVIILWTWIISYHVFDTMRNWNIFISFL